MSLDTVRPLIVPRDYFDSGQFPAPHERLAASDLALTWVELLEDERMLYITPARAESWDREAPDWREQALNAMRAADEGRVYTHEKRTSWGDLAWVSMMHDDGLGSSRLLLRAELEMEFPAGYWIALPDRSCGMAISRSLSITEVDELRSLVAKMHRNATTPMLPDLRDPDDLLSQAV
jgi:hypothetical protein